MDPLFNNKKGLIVFGKENGIGKSMLLKSFKIALAEKAVILNLENEGITLYEKCTEETELIIIDSAHQHRMKELIDVVENGVVLHGTSIRITPNILISSNLPMENLLEIIDFTPYFNSINLK